MTAIRSGNIAAHLTEMARLQGEKPALLIPRGNSHQVISYAELEDWSNRCAAGLANAGIERGMRAVLMVPPSLEFFGLTFALFKLGAAPVLIDPGMGIANLGACLDQVRPAALIGVPKAMAAQRLLGWAKRHLRLRVTVGGTWFWGGLTLERILSGGAAASSTAKLAENLPDAPAGLDEANATAAILFTSGSTGVPKGAVYTHEIFQAQVGLLRELFEIEAGEIDLCTFPLFALFAPALGMSAIVPQMDFTSPASVHPPNILGPVQGKQVSNLFGSPALLDRVSRYAQSRGLVVQSGLKRVLSAGAPVSPRILQRMAETFPGVEVYTPYGATEALPVAVIGSTEVLRETRALTERGAGVCVGRVVPGAQVRIIAIADGPIAQWRDELALSRGEIGEIVVRGPMVTREYFERPELTALAKIADPAGGFFHRMGDLGYFDEHGRLWFCGRKSQRVVTEQGTLFTDCCEGVFNAHPAVARSALVGVGPGATRWPVLCVEPETWGKPEQREELGDQLLALGRKQECTRTIRTIIFRRRFPVDIRHNAKIFREKLAIWATEHLA